MAEIVLGGRVIALRPLTLRQLRTILPAFARAREIGGAAMIDAAIEVIAGACARDCPEITAEALLDIEATSAELSAAVRVVARLSGLEDASSGEARAGR